MTTAVFDDLTKAVIEAAHQELLSRFNHVSIRYKADGSVLTDADIAMNERLVRELRERFPDDGVLSEEMSRQTQRRKLGESGHGLWVLDPLDGTTNFAAGLPYFCVSLALLRQGKVEFAMVYDPVRKECFQARGEKGAWLNDQRLRGSTGAPSLSRSIALIDFKRLSRPLAQRLSARPPYASQRSFGAVALDLCWVAANRAHIYLHGRHHLWDYIAGLTILRGAGGHDRSLEEGLQEFDITPKSTIAALDKRLFNSWSEWLREAESVAAGQARN